MGPSCITFETLGHRADVTISELRNHGGDVVDRVAAGERLIITRSGKPVAELRPVHSGRLTAAALRLR